MGRYLLATGVVALFLSSATTASDGALDEYDTPTFRFIKRAFHEAAPKKQIQLEGWPKGLPAAGSAAPGYLRSIIHLHSVYSHDACDRKPLPNGKPDPKCVASLRSALCDVRVDAAFLTEHSGHMAEHSFEEVMNVQPGDLPILEDGRLTGVTHLCPNGHAVHLYLGSENELMGLGLTRHLEPEPGQTLSEAYRDSTPDALPRYRTAGGLVGVPHSEDTGKSVDYLEGLGADFMEIYNLHAEFVLLNESSFFHKVGKLFDFLGFSINPFYASDLVYTAIQTENERALNKWAALAQRQHIAGVAGSDSHQNVLNVKMYDGERMDSYRRTLRWFTNYIQAPDPGDRVSLLNAIRQGRIMAVFELYGMPKGFEFSASDGFTCAGMGGTLQAGGEYTVRLKLEELVFTGKSSRKPRLRGRILKAEGERWVEVASGNPGNLEYAGHSPGVYRAEVLVRPAHLSEYLPNRLRWNKEHVWIYSNPVWVR